MIRLKNLLREESTEFKNLYDCLVKNPDRSKRWKQEADNFKTKTAGESTMLSFSKTIKDWSTDKHIDYMETDMVLSLSIIKDDSTLFDNTSTCKITAEFSYRTEKEWDSSIGSSPISKTVTKTGTFKINTFDCASLQKKIDIFIAQFDKYRNGI
jgi:hypothetical protein